jgi:hypothetical protein
MLVVRLTPRLLLRPSTCAGSSWAKEKDMRTQPRLQSQVRDSSHDLRWLVSLFANLVAVWGFAGGGIPLLRCCQRYIGDHKRALMRACWRKWHLPPRADTCHHVLTLSRLVLRGSKRGNLPRVVRCLKLVRVQGGASIRSQIQTLRQWHPKSAYTPFFVFLKGLKCID